MPAKKQPKDFEQSLNSLTEIVEAMESDQLPLEELITHYEKGSELLKDCEDMLNSAKKRLETINNQAKTSRPTPATPASDDDEIRLF